MKVFRAQSWGKRATSQRLESRARAVPRDREGRASGAKGSPSLGFSQRAMDHSADSRRVSAAYSPSSRCWRTSNWRGPTAPRRTDEEDAGASRSANSEATPSLRSCSRPDWKRLYLAVDLLVR